VIGGSGFNAWPELDWSDECSVATPYGEPSSPLRIGRCAGCRIVFLARHGQGHALAPHAINYRANLWALKQAQVESLIACATVGAISPEVSPGSLCVPDQLIDYTWGRLSSYGEAGQVVHVDFTQPFDARLRQAIVLAAGGTTAIVDGGTYACTQGPRLETAAEIRRLAADGCTVVGMTAMPEAVLARELGVPYALLCLAVNAAAGLGESFEGIDHESLAARVRNGIAEVKALLVRYFALPPAQAD
jgi:5'-methylthioadenosine phosphorylase